MHFFWATCRCGRQLCATRSSSEYFVKGCRSRTCSNVFCSFFVSSIYLLSKWSKWVEHEQHVQVMYAELLDKIFVASNIHIIMIFRKKKNKKSSVSPSGPWPTTLGQDLGPCPISSASTVPSLPAGWTWRRIAPGWWATCRLARVLGQDG